MLSRPPSERLWQVHPLPDGCWPAREGSLLLLGPAHLVPGLLWKPAWPTGMLSLEL